MGEFIVGVITGICIGFAIILISGGKDESAIAKHNCIEYNKTTGKPYWLDDNSSYK